MSTEALPRTIAPSEVRVGMRLRVTDTNDENELIESYEGVVSAVNVNGFIIGEARSRGFSSVGWNLTLLSRPTPRGPAWDAPMGSLWETPAGAIYARNGVKDFPDQLISNLLVNMSTKTGHVPGLCRRDHADLIDSLTLFVMPPSELDTLRQNVINAAEQRVCAEHPGKAPCSHWLCTAVRALRDAESKS